MYEFVTANGASTPKLGEGEFYIHFSVSCYPCGRSWVVHHLAKTAVTPEATGKYMLTQLGIPGMEENADRTTYLKRCWISTHRARWRSAS